MIRKPLIISILAAFLSLALVTSCANNTTYPGSINVIEAADAIAARDKAVIVDARSGEEYAKGHMKEAVHLSPDQLTTDIPVPGTLTSGQQVSDTLGKAGISNDSIVYIYDDNAGVSASRVWWAMKVYGHNKVMIINGGSAALVRAKAELSAEPVTPVAVVYQAKAPNQEMMATFEEIKALAETPHPGTVLIDVRSDAEYSQGHIPGAKLYPHTHNLYKDGTFMSSRDLRLFYQDEKITPSQDIILYCKTSFRAAQTAALLQEAGFKKVRVYDGAWLEWEQQMGPETSTEDSAPVGSSDGS